MDLLILLINKGVWRMTCCKFNSDRILYITTEILILVASYYSYAQRTRVRIIKLSCLTYELVKVTIVNVC